MTATSTEPRTRAARRVPNRELVSLFVADALAEGLEIDAEKGVIDGVSVITLGEATGHGFIVDSVLLNQVVDGINAAPDGVKVRITHPEKSGADGAMFLVGRIRNARLDGDRVRATLMLGDYAKTNPHGDLWTYILSIAQNDPTVLGLSVVFYRAHYEFKPGPGGTQLAYGRASGVFAVDLTDFPAANSNGLLAGDLQGAIVMSNLAAKLEEILGQRAENEQARTDLIYALASAAGVESFVVSDLLSGVAMCPTAEQLEAFASTLNVDVNELRSAAESDGCEFGEAPTAPDDGAAAGAVGAGGEDPASMSAGSGAGANAGGDPPSNGQTGSGGPPAMDAVNRAFLSGGEASRQRFTALSGIAKTAGLGQEWVHQQFKSPVTVDKARELAMQHMAQRNQPPQIAGGTDHNIESLGAAVSDALAMRARPSETRRGLPQVDSQGMVMLDGTGAVALRKPHERARQFLHLSLLETAREYLRCIGVDVAGKSKREIAQLVFNKAKLAAATSKLEFLMHSGADFPAILADTINKTLRQAYEESMPTWQRVFREAFTSDFKQISRTQLSGVATPDRVYPGQEYTYAHLADTKEVYALGKYGHIVSIDWETIINDDTDAFSRVPMLQGNACARLEDDLAWAQVTSNPTMADGTDLFHADHGNLGTAGDISVTTLGELRKLMRVQKGLTTGDGAAEDRLNLAMRHLVVPAALETKADQIVASTVDPSKSNDTPNPFHNRLDVTAEPRLDDTSASEWYVAASIAQVDTVEVCFLEGERQPFLDEEEGFSIDGRRYKVRHCCAAKVIDHRGLAKNPWTGS